MGYIVEEAKKLEDQIENTNKAHFKYGLEVGYMLHMKQNGATWEEIAAWAQLSVSTVRNRLLPYINLKDRYDFLRIDKAGF